MAMPHGRSHLDRFWLWFTLFIEWEQGAGHLASLVQSSTVHFGLNKGCSVQAGFITVGLFFAQARNYIRVGDWILEKEHESKTLDCECVGDGLCVAGPGC